MALTQSARLPGGPSWDDEVVPALRKRLEGESRMLSKRISAAVSISSLEELEPSYQPRPSLTQPRASVDRNQQSPRPGKQNGAAPSSKQRARTYSQPKLSEIPTNKSRTPEPKPTRIPKVARGRTTSVSGNTNGHMSPPPPRSADSPDLRRLNNDDPALLGVPPAKIAKQPSQDTIHIPMRQTSGLLNEPAPFRPGPESANSHDEAPPRPSNESEERPFEHWYRGEVSRNGGVGELRLGKRAEMLEIANYGHTMKQKQALRETEAVSNQRRRKRSESAAGIEAQHRESLYLDDDETAHNISRVLDEGPLTDVDAEMSDGDFYNQYYDAQDHEETPPEQYREYGATTPTQMQTTPRQTRIPSPSAQQQRAVTPTPAPPMKRGQSEPPSVPASSSLSQASRQLQNGANKRAATASPPAGSSSVSKKPRGAATTTPKPKPKTQTKRGPNTIADDKNRRSVAYYPSPGGDDDEEDLADAIPTWTQPVKPETGRWDDVVLPVVARKKGLDGHYETADGSPKPKKEDRPVEPAAGTFGWDHSKYRPPRDDMDEFGRPIPMSTLDERGPLSPEEEEALAFGHKPAYPPTEHEQQPVGPRPPPSQPQPPPQMQERRRSPPPFSNYQGDVLNNNIDLEAQMKVGAGGGRGAQREEEDGGAGCCKCVLM
ncbi:hypothetical protein MSAN_01343300 [Mycena sanguinolenta]|uniref:Uncharacterized protein n=1 Tax=Mycena sanguinolenta TaxID=230812 RepID=A0A8H6YFS1_9AGAR|nr:hypothetical protein MSAN_01343300 [Mycena sanguinolenta]